MTDAPRTPLALFDRDGTLIVDKHYQFDPGGIDWIPGAFAALRLAAARGYRVGVLTNQSAVARGICSEAQVAAFHATMDVQCVQAGVRVDFWDYCPFHGDGHVARYRIADHPDRKPNPGMVLRALRQRNGDAARSFMIGDRDSDVQAGERAGIRGVLFAGDEPLDRPVRRVLDALAG